MKLSFASLGIVVSSVGLGVAMLPEIMKVHRNPASALSISPLFLWMRVLFFVILGVALFAKSDPSLIMMAVLCIWYVLCYGYILSVYRREKAKRLPTPSPSSVKAS